MSLLYCNRTKKKRIQARPLNSLTYNIVSIVKFLTSNSMPEKKGIIVYIELP